MYGILVDSWISLIELGPVLFSRRVKEATHGVVAVGALLVGFKVKLG